MVNAFFHARFAGERRPNRTGDFGRSEAKARVPHLVRGDGPVERRTYAGLGTSTPDLPKILANPFEINNKIKMFAPADKNFLTIFPEHLAANECCEPRV
jgi:hypothetical protein